MGTRYVYNKGVDGTTPFSTLRDSISHSSLFSDSFRGRPFGSRKNDDYFYTMFTGGSSKKT